METIAQTEESKSPTENAPPSQKDNSIKPEADRNASITIWNDKKWMFAAVVILIAIGTVLRFANLDNISWRTPDERFYTQMASTLVHEGTTAGIRKMTDNYLKDTGVANYFPPPTRVGYLWALSSTMSVVGSDDVKAGADLSFIASIVSLIMLALIGWRYLGPMTAIVALLFYIVSPVELMIARRAWQESFVECLTLMLIYISLRISESDKRTSLFAIFGILGGFLVTVKEAGAVAVFISAVLVLWILLKRGNKQDALTFAGFAFAGVLAGVAWLAYSFGGFGEIAAFVGRMASVDNTNTYSVKTEGGPPWKLFYILWIMSPAIFIGCAITFAILIRRRSYPIDPQLRENAIWLSIFVLVFVLTSALAPHKINPRYIALSCGASYIIGGFGLLYCIRKAGDWFGLKARPMFISGVCIVLVAGVWLDYGTFQVFAKTEIGDLTGRMVLDPYGHSEVPSLRPDASGKLNLQATEENAAAHPSPDTYLNLSLAYFQANRYGDCITAARNAIALQPDFPDAYNNISGAFRRMSQWDSAITAANESNLLEPNNHFAKINLDAAMQGKNAQLTGGSVSNLEKIASEQATPENYINLSAAYYQAGQFQNCIDAARKAIALRPDFSTAYSNICAANNRLGNFAEGKKAGEEAVRIDPNNQLAKNNLKWSIDELNKK